MKPLHSSLNWGQIFQKMGFWALFAVLIFSLSSCQNRRQTVPNGGVYADSPYIKNNYPGSQDTPKVDESEVGDPKDTNDSDFDNGEFEDGEFEEDEGPRELTPEELEQQQRDRWEYERKQQIKRGFGRFGLIILQLAMDIGLWYLLTR